MQRVHLLRQALPPPLVSVARQQLAARLAPMLAPPLVLVRRMRLARQLPPVRQVLLALARHLPLAPLLDRQRAMRRAPARPPASKALSPPMALALRQAAAAHRVSAGQRQPQQAWRAAPAPPTQLAFQLV